MRLGNRDRRNRRVARRQPRRRRPPRPVSSDSDDTFMSTLFTSLSTDSVVDDDTSDEQQRHRDKRPDDRRDRRRSDNGDGDENNNNNDNDNDNKCGEIGSATVPPLGAAGGHIDNNANSHAAAGPVHQRVARTDQGLPAHHPTAVGVCTVPCSAAPAVIGTPDKGPSNGDVLPCQATGAVIEPLPVPWANHMYADAPIDHHRHHQLVAHVSSLAPPLRPGPRPAFTILRQATPAATREYAALPTVRPWRELARAVDPTGRMPLDGHAVWCGDADGTLTLPARFDGRRRWSGLLTQPHDQGISGACWAHAVVSALGDRAALWTHGAARPWPDGIERRRVFSGLSPRDIIDRDFDTLTDAQAEGEAAVVVANEAQHGAHHADYGHTLAGALEALYVDGVTCHGGWRCRPLAYYGLASATEIDIKAEIFAWGPVASAFALYEDFMHPTRYPSSWIGGVYRHDASACRRICGGHAVVLVGWCEAWLPREHDASTADATTNNVYHTLGRQGERHHHHGDHANRHARMTRHTCWIARHAWGSTWAGGAHADGYFVMVAGQCHIESNVVGCVPDIHGMSIDPRDAHRVAPPSAHARRKRAMRMYLPSADLIGPDRVDPSLLPDMSAFVAGEIHERGIGAHHDDAVEYVDGSLPPSDAWTTALRRAWTPLGCTETADDQLRLMPYGVDVGTIDSVPADAYSVPAVQGPSMVAQRHLPWHDRDPASLGTDPHPAVSSFAAPYGHDAAPLPVPTDVRWRDDRHSDDICHSNSDAELSDDERRLDAQHRLQRRDRRRRPHAHVRPDTGQ